MNSLGYNQAAWSRVTVVKVSVSGSLQEAWTMDAAFRQHSLRISRWVIIAWAAILPVIALSSCEGPAAGTPSAAHQTSAPAHSISQPASSASRYAHPAVRSTGPSSRIPGNPVARFVPDHGPVGTVVRVTGSGFDPSLANRSATAIGLALIRDFPDGCELIGGAANRPLTLRISKAGRLTGEFAISGAPGQCFQEPGRKHRVTPGAYHVSIGCLACYVGTFRVTSGTG